MICKIPLVRRSRQGEDHGSAGSMAGDQYTAPQLRLSSSIRVEWGGIFPGPCVLGGFNLASLSSYTSVPMVILCPGLYQLSLFASYFL